MNFPKISPEIQLILFILQEAEKYKLGISKTQLIKFLYLADVFFARKYRGKTWTGWKWRYWHYGPYCEEAIETIQKAESLGLIESKQIENGDILKPKFKIDAFCSEIPMEFITLLGEAVKKYGGDLYRLLNFVYFSTEPMIEAEKGQFLDFSKCIPLEQIWAYRQEVPVPPPMPKKKRNFLRQKLKELTELRLAREARKKRKREKLSPEMVLLLEKFEEWCERA